jgi:hypothetical protein
MPKIDPLGGWASCARRNLTSASPYFRPQFLFLPPAARRVSGSGMNDLKPASANEPPFGPTPSITIMPAHHVRQFLTKARNAISRLARNPKRLLRTTVPQGADGRHDDRRQQILGDRGRGEKTFFPRPPAEERGEMLAGRFVAWPAVRIIIEG